MKIVRYFSHPDGVYPPVEPEHWSMPREYVPLDSTEPLTGRWEIVDAPEDYTGKGLRFPPERGTASDRLDEIEMRWADAVPGPWKYRDAKASYTQDYDQIVGPRGELLLVEPTSSSISGSWSTGEATAETYLAVAAAPEDVAWLIAEVRRLRWAALQEAAKMCEDTAEKWPANSATRGALLALAISLHATAALPVRGSDQERGER